MVLFKKSERFANTLGLLEFFETIKYLNSGNFSLLDFPTNQDQYLYLQIQLTTVLGT